MTLLPDFRLETYFSRWEFVVSHNLAASDAQTCQVRDLLALADDEDREAWEELSLGYTETFGDPLLRQAIAGTYQGIDADDVICFAGAEEALYLTMHALLGPDDHAVVVTPCYQSAETVPMSLCEVTGVALDPNRDWALDLDEVRAALRPSTRVVSVNFPNNPTGKVLSHADFRALVAMCDERGIRLFSDEVYRGVERDPARTLPQAAELSPAAISMNVTSKALGLPGLRIGWIVCRDRALRSALERAKHYTTICNSGPSEVLARIAIKARDHLLARTSALIGQNLPRFEEFFAGYPALFDFTAPDGGCVCFPRYLGGDVEAFCASLAEQASVLLLPSSVFRSELTETPHDHFRVGIGRSGADVALGAVRAWLGPR